ncbi:MAG: 3-hydroxybutyrate dehydrogenase [Planctomycetota bacterium]|nr:3-hydroxybutyrate dehydrogenase [Planctomycetota bacterium]
MPPPPLTFLITGAGSGLGRGLAEHFLRAGHAVIGCDVAPALHDDPLFHAAPARALVFDVSDPAQVERAIGELGAARLDVLVNNAGLQHVAKVEEFPPETWGRLIDIMLKGPFLLSRQVLPRMRAQGYGRIVNVGSIHSLIASPFKSAYVAAKHGLVGLAKTLALETAGADITVNTICPSYIHTPLVDKQIGNQAQVHGLSEQEVIEKIMLEPMPKKAFIGIDEVAGAIEFLCGPAARNITGQTLVMDGGWTAR